MQPAKPLRSCVSSARLRHAPLALVQYGVFFQLCRANGIGFDVAEREGTVFALLDGFQREALAMLTVSDTLQNALALFARNVRVIQKEVDVPAVPAPSIPSCTFTGFTGAAAPASNLDSLVRDIDAVYNLAALNATADSGEQPLPLPLAEDDAAHEEDDPRAAHSAHSEHSAHSHK